MRRQLLLAPLVAALLLALPASTQAFEALKVEKQGAGAGTVTSSPVGINCGPTCQASFNTNAVVTLSGAPDANSEPAQWSGCDSIVEGKCKVQMSAPRTVTATFAPLTHQLSVTRAGTGTGTVSSSPAGISCGSTCQASYQQGTLLTLTAAPAEGSEAVKWTGCDSVNGEGKCIVTMSAAKGITASFEAKPQLTLTKAGEGASLSSVQSAPAGIECGSSCSATYPKGTQVTLTPASGTHVKAAQWTGCEAILAGNKCKVTLNASTEVSATFELQSGFAFNLITVLRSGTGQGTVSSSPGQILCGAICSGEFLTATTLTLNATPAQGSVFAHWSGGGCSGAGPCTTTVKAEATVKAVFTASGTRTLTVSKAGSGTGTVSGKAAGIACGSACSSQVPAAKKVTLRAKPAAGSTFAHWSGACSGAAKTCTVAMTEARSVVATFTAPQAAAPPSCVVPRLAGKSPRKARAALAAAHCALGKVRKPKARKGKKLGPLVVRSSSPSAGTTLPAGGKVDLRLAKKHRPGHGGRRHP